MVLEARGILARQFGQRGLAAAARQADRFAQALEVDLVTVALTRGGTLSGRVTDDSLVICAEAEDAYEEDEGAADEDLLDDVPPEDDTSDAADDAGTFDSQRTAPGFITRIDAKHRHQVHEVEADRVDLDLDFLRPQWRANGLLPPQMIRA